MTLEEIKTRQLQGELSSLNDNQKVIFNWLINEVEQLQEENQRLLDALKVVAIDACTCHERRHSSKCGSCVAEQALKGGE